MNDINKFALQKATEAAAKLWALGSAPFPLANGALIQRYIEQEVIDAAIGFAIHARRILDNMNINASFALNQPFRHWESIEGLPKVDTLREALNRIVHAVEFEVGFERLPSNAAKIIGGSIGVIYLRTKTDKRDLALIDVFALASCFFYDIIPEIKPPSGPSVIH